MKKIFIVYSLALFFVLLFFVYFLLNPLKFPETNLATTPEEEHQSTYDWDRILAESMNKPHENLYTALEKNNISFCKSRDGIEPELCRKIFLSVQEKCSEGKPFEKIFCIAFIEKKKEYCDFISLDWYAITCRAIIDENPNPCMEIDSVKNRALCVRDLAVNIEGLDCSPLEPDWKALCVAHKDFDSEECNAIADSKIREECLALFNM